MGKASKWFRGLLGLKKPDSPSPPQPPAKPAKEKRRWSFVKSSRERDQQYHAAPKPAASSSPLPAVRIQSAFRGYLARKALRALKGLVRLQALVRGHIERKNTLRRMQALLRAQARARAGRSQMSDSSHSSSKSSQSHYMDPATPEKSERFIHTRSSKYDPLSTQKRNGPNGVYERNRLDRYSDDQTHEQCVDDERNNNDKILEIDTGKQHHFSMKSRNLFQSQSQQALSSDLNSHSFTTSKDSYEVQSLNPLKFSQEEDGPFCTADNSPQFYSASSRGGGGGSSGRSPFTPSKSDGQRSCYLSGYSDHPNYMSYTESSKAKARSLSAPKQRPHYVDRSGSSKRNSIHGLFGESRSGSLKVSVSALQASFTSKAYPGSGRLDRLGMPIGFKC